MVKQKVRFASELLVQSFVLLSLMRQIRVLLLGSVEIIVPEPQPGGALDASLIQLELWVKVIAVGCWEVFNWDVPGIMIHEIVPPL